MGLSPLPPPLSLASSLTCTAATGLFKAQFYPDLPVTLPCSLPVRDANCEWSVSKQPLHCQKTLRPIYISCEYQWDAHLDLCYKTAIVWRGGIVGLSGALRPVNAARHRSSMWVIPQRLRAIPLFTACLCRLRLKRWMTVCKQTTCKDSYTSPDGALLRFFLHKDSGSLVCWLFFSAHVMLCSEKQTNS